tara:strand:- start:171 stop:509 length:339 start_codon:yes stop_codon:yes gene_type:complete
MSIWTAATVGFDGLISPGVMGRTVAGERSRWLGSDCDVLSRLNNVPPGFGVGAVSGLGTTRLRLAKVVLLAMLVTGASRRGAVLARERGLLLALFAGLGTLASTEAAIGASR